ncbi:hypothetical protein ACTFIU_001137 [Dictyostelium citrinum]
MKNNILFIGNFVNDVILIHQKLKLERERSFTDFMSPEVQKELSKNYDTNDNHCSKDVIKAEALGGSVTYGSLAAHYFGDTKSFIVTKFGDDINKEFQQLIQSKQSIDLTFTETIKDIKNTSYFLNYYNNKKNRTLSLMEKGNQISIEACIKCIDSIHPDALLFVPVAGEFDEHLVMKTLEIVNNINQHREKQQQQQHYRPIIAFDVQGFLRSFNGARVTTRPMNVMIEKLINIKMSLNGMENDIITVVKAEYGEAAAIMGDHDPATCAKLLRLNFGFTIVAVTMGGDGLFLSSSITGEIYIPTFKPTQVSDETGCGDTFLTCTILELLNLLKIKKQFNHENNQNNNNKNNNNNNKVDENSFQQQQHHQQIHDILIKLNIKKEELIQCLQVGSSGASFLVEKIGPNGFASREKIMDRVLNGTKQIKQHYLEFNNPINHHGGEDNEHQKIIRQEQVNDNNDNNNSKSSQTSNTIKEFVEQQKLKQKQFKSTTNYK